MINKACCSAAMRRANVYRWYARFLDGRENVRDDARSGRPSTDRTEENVESVRHLLTEVCRSTLKMIPHRLNIGKKTVRRIVIEDLGRKKDLREIFPHALTTEQKQERVIYFQDLLLMGQDKHFGKIFSPVTKHGVSPTIRPPNVRVTDWMGKSYPKPKKLPFQKSRVKTLLIAFFDASRDCP